MFYGVIDHSTWRMSPNYSLKLNRPVPDRRVEMFAIRDGDYPGG